MFCQNFLHTVIRKSDAERALPAASGFAVCGAWKNYLCEVDARPSGLVRKCEKPRTPRNSRSCFAGGREVGAGCAAGAGSANAAAQAFTPLQRRLRRGTSSVLACCSSNCCERKNLSALLFVNFSLFLVSHGGFRVFSTATVTLCHPEQCFSLLHSTLLEGDRELRGRSLLIFEKSG